MTQNTVENLIGRQIGKYAIQSEIGRGGMGVVYRGYDTMLQRTVAVKVLPPSFGHDQEFVRRFRREAILAANLHHPNIVTIHDVGEEQDLHFIVMELVEGVTLEQWLRQHGTMSLQQISQVVRQVAAALDYAHGRGVVHRDVKPSNVMLSSDMRVKLMDFGLVRAAEGDGLTRTGTIVGTPEYMAPEQALGQPVDGRTDIYALGVVLYRLLAGGVPFARSTPYAVTYAHIHESPPPLRGARPDLPPVIEQVVTRALAKSPADRFQRADELARHLEAAANASAPRAEPPAQAIQPASAREARVSGGHPPARTPAAVPSVSGRQSRLVPVLMVVTALLLAAVLGLVWMLSRSDRTGAAVPSAAVANPTVLQAPAIVLATLTQAPTPTALPRATDTPKPSAPTSTRTATVTSTREPTASPTVALAPTPTPQPTAAPTASPSPQVRPTSTPAPAAASRGTVLDFESFGIWKRGDEPYGTLTQTTEQVHGGSYAARLDYDIPPVANSYVVFLRTPPVAVPGQPQALTIWVYGDGSNHFLNAWIRDNDSEVRQFTFGRVAHAGSWQQMTLALDPGAAWPQGHISGPDNGRLDYPISLSALVLDAVISTRTSGAIYLDDLVAGDAPLAAASPSTRATTPATAVAPPQSAPSLSGHIVYASGESTLTALDVASGNIWPVAGNARQPDIHGDGLVVADGIGGGRLNLFTVTLSRAERIIGMHPEDSYPHWNPSGDGIVFHSTLQGDGKERIYLQWATHQAAEPTALKIGAYPVLGRNATWLANGRIAFSGCNYWASGSNCGIWTLGPNGSNPLQVTERMDDISSDGAGDQLLYSSQITGNWDVFVAPAGGGTPRNLTNSPYQDAGATFSPDGQHIAFISDREGGWGIWIMLADGSSPFRRLAVPEGFGANWANERLAWGP